MIGATPFMMATASLDVNAMRLLKASGADPVIATKKNITPLMVAAGLGNLDVQDRTNEEKNNALEAAKLCWELGVDVNAVGEFSYTAMHGAAYAGEDAIIEFLVSKGAKMDVKDEFGQTPLTIAEGLITTGIIDFYKKPHGPHKSTSDLLLRLGATPLAASGVQIVEVLPANLR